MPGRWASRDSPYTETGVMWQAIIHGLFVLSAIGIAYVEKLGQPAHVRADTESGWANGRGGCFSACHDPRKRGIQYVVSRPSRPIRRAGSPALRAIAALLMVLLVTAHAGADDAFDHWLRNSGRQRKPRASRARRSTPRRAG